jgi:imidazolonepropionase-like amidohydrolase
MQQPATFLPTTRLLALMCDKCATNFLSQISKSSSIFLRPFHPQLSFLGGRMISSLMRVASAVLVFAFSVYPQTVPTVGLHENTPTVHAFTNARIVVKPGSVIAKGTLVVRDGVIESVGESVIPPADARVWDMQGATLYAGLIDLASDYGMPKPPQPGQGVGQQPQVQPTGPKGAAHWNSKMLADTRADAEFSPDAKTAEKLRSQGFTLVNAVPQKGIFRGLSALISLADVSPSEAIAKGTTAQCVALEPGGFAGGAPSSQMGVVAFLRQMFMDADWYRRAWESYAKNPSQQKPETNNALAALVDAARGKQPVMMTASDELNFLRAAKLGKEFGLNLWVLGSGKEFRRLDAVKNTKLPVVLPLNFPETPNVDVPEEALNVSLEELLAWDIAPENPGRLEKSGVPITLTAAQLKDAGTFLAQVRKAIERGLSADGALAALTTTPAKWLGLELSYGSLEKGRRANIVVTDGDLFAEKTKIREVWVNGKRHEVKPPLANDPRGVWTLNTPLTSAVDTLTLNGEADKLTGSLKIQGKSLNLAAPSFSAGRLTFSFVGDSVGIAGTVRLSAAVSATEMFGVGDSPDGSQWRWSATRKEPAKEEPDTTKPKKPEMALFPDVFPSGEFGRTKFPDQQTVLVKNATVWTQGPQGKLDGADILVSKGKIQQVGKNLSAPKEALVVDGTGKNVTPGMIDAHSHIAVSGSVNEFGPAITCNVRIADVLEPDDIWIYRQLAGGTVAANILHGSANPIGGQNAIIKHRWGALPDELLLQGAPQGVKFALGENVKQSHVGGAQGRSQRYPHTRMGVDQIIRDRFQAGLDYERTWKDWELDKSNIPPRKDLELDALLEMVKGTRKIHAHSYRQDEILMLIRAAEDYHIKIATFQHALEAYKVADAIAKHGAGASGFSDWWAYKHEAYDAIPGNFPLVAKQGVLVSFNSDDAQLASRLNWEAAKAVPYGISEEEALKFVTINPAKQLGIDKFTGSLEAGKDADFVIWSGNPLSTYSKCEQTWVDGRKMFDVQEDAQMQSDAIKQRGALIQKILKSKTPATPPSFPGGTRPRRPGEEQPKHCDDGIVEYELSMNGGGL